MPVLSQVDYRDLSSDVRLDSDFYAPEHLRNEAVYQKLAFSRLSALADVSDGNHLAIAERFCEQGVRYLRGRGQDLSDFFISDDAPLYISEGDYAGLARSHMKPGDLLIGIVGSIGNLSLVTAGHGKLTGNCKIAIVRSKSIKPEVLAAWFYSKYGQGEIRRQIRGSVQMGVILPDLRQLRVPKLPVQLTEKLIALVRAAEKCRANAARLYPDAEAETLDRLGWDTLIKHPIETAFAEKLSSVNQSGRLDAEHFQPRYQRLRKHLRSTGAKTLGELWLSCDKGTQPAEYRDVGEVIVVKAKNVLGQAVDLETCDRAPLSTWEDVHARLRGGDLIINSTGRGTLGRAAVIPAHSEKAVASVDLLIVRLRRELIRAEYAALFLNSPAGLAQSDQYQTGSSGQLHLYRRYVRQFLIYLPFDGNGNIDIRWQDKVVQKIVMASAAKTEAQAKLNEAKALVEFEIERQLQ